MSEQHRRLKLKAAQSRATPASRFSADNSQARLPLSLGFKYPPEAQHHHQLPASAVKEQGGSQHQHNPDDGYNCGCDQQRAKGRGANRKHQERTERAFQIQNYLPHTVFFFNIIFVFV